MSESFFSNLIKIFEKSVDFVFWPCCNLPVSGVFNGESFWLLGNVAKMIENHEPHLWRMRFGMESHRDTLDFFPPHPGFQWQMKV